MQTSARLKPNENASGYSGWEVPPFEIVGVAPRGATRDSSASARKMNSTTQASPRDAPGTDFVHARDRVRWPSTEAHLLCSETRGLRPSRPSHLTTSHGSTEGWTDARYTLPHHFVEDTALTLPRHLTAPKLEPASPACVERRQWCGCCQADST
jgi:hypothetical protein